MSSTRSPATSPSPVGPRAALVLLALTAACEPELVIGLAAGPQQIPSPTFVVREASGETPPRYDTVRLYEGESLVWHLRGDPGGTPRPATFAYPGPLPGFTEVVPPVPLRAGADYVLVISGTGRGQLRFSVSAEGVVRAAP